MGFLGFGPEDIAHDFNYDVDETAYNTDRRLDSAFGRLGSQGKKLNTMAAGFQRRADEFLDPDSSWMTDNRANLAKDIYDQAGQQANVINSMMAQRGAGGMAGLLSAVNQNRGAESVRKGFLNLVNQGVGYGQNFANMGLNAAGQATNAINMAGNLAQGIDARATQVALANSQAINQRNQYANQGAYERDKLNAARSDAFQNALLGAGTTLLGNAFGLGGIFGQAPGDVTNQIFGDNPGIYGEAVGDK